MDPYIRTKARLIVAMGKLLTTAWVECFLATPEQREQCKARYHQIASAQSMLLEAIKIWLKNASMTQLLELDVFFSDKETVDTSIFPFIAHLYESQSELLLGLLCADKRNLEVHAGTLKTVFWRADKTFARMFVNKLKASPLWQTNPTMCVYLAGQLVTDPLT